MADVSQSQLDQLENSMRNEIRHFNSEQYNRLEVAIKENRGMNMGERDRLIRLETRFALVEEAVVSMRKEVKEMHDALTEAKGGWKVLLAFSAVAGAFGAIMVKFPWSKIIS